MKASAYGNDFLMLWDSDFAGDRHAATISLCDRRMGIGADGVEWLRKDLSDECDVIATLINSDGSEAEISGNGTRCVAAYLQSLEEHAHLRPWRIRTGAGIKECEFLSRDEQTYRFAMEMGKPARIEERTVGEWSGVFVDLGNPHFVVIGDKLPENWRDVARFLQERMHAFPEGVNVEFAQVESRGRVRAHFFERGAGETSSSGTGSCASAVACRSRGLVDGGVEVAAPGGTQIVEVGESLRLHGDARLVCRGEAWL